MHLLTQPKGRALHLFWIDPQVGLSSMIQKHTLAPGKERHDPEVYTPLWFRISSLLLLAVAIVLLVIVLGERVYASNLAVAALAAVLLALGCAAFLHVRAWY